MQSELVLEGLLRERFGLERFRPLQAEVCAAAASGADVLLVMPTGAGKSLCYQLPGVARKGVTLVISPLIALMEDQAQRLEQRGFRAARIHSGVPREAARAACRAYLDAQIDFLFIAPERMRVPGFPEMLAKRRPALIAVDEAHCISAWGHDFRPDYRMLKAHIQKLRPSPVIALTATATPAVQEDIVRELEMQGERRFVHGFRRANIAVEVCERPPKERIDAAVEILADASRRPAIVYASTRKSAEEAAAAMPRAYRAAAYHAGMTPPARDRVQRMFLAGELDVIVATIAFGMGVDKADIRTVIHLALPGSVEGYYQEIGRAGRDGLPSRAVLYHSYADIKTHEFFFARDYPEVAVLRDAFDRLQRRRTTRESLGDAMKVAPDILERALEKLWLFGALQEDEDSILSVTELPWAEPYAAQREHRWQHVEKMRRLAEGAQCRMAALVRHFGDREDAALMCGTCDVCAPHARIAELVRPATQAESNAADHVRAILTEERNPTVGQIFRSLPAAAAIERNAFDQILFSLVQRGEIRLAEDVFQKDGRDIVFMRAHAVDLDLTGATPLVVADRKKKSSRKSRSGERAPRASREERAARRASREVASDDRPDAPEALVEALRAFRKAEAAKTKVPAFRILTDRVLFGIAARGPGSLDELMTVSGVGQSTAKKYGNALLAIVEQHQLRGA